MVRDSNPGAGSKGLKKKLQSWVLNPSLLFSLSL